MNKFFDTVYALSNIKRFSTHRVNQIQNVATHSFNCAMIALYIVDADKVTCDKGILLQKVLLHDLVEGVLGDIPAPTRDYSPELKSKIKEVEVAMLDSIFKDCEVNYKQIATESKQGMEGEIVALADIIERLIYLSTERRSGNTLPDSIYNSTVKKLKTKEMKALLKKYPTASELLFHYLSAIK